MAKIFVYGRFTEPEAASSDLEKLKAHIESHYDSNIPLVWTEHSSHGFQLNDHRTGRWIMDVEVIE